MGSACQLRCAHCYATDVTAQKVPLGRLAATIAELDRLGCLAVMLVGGEPTLRRDLPEIVAAVARRRMLPFLFSNGVALERARLAELREAGLFGLFVSFLGVGERHDRFVGVAGSWERATRALADARDLGLFTSVNVTATRDAVQRGEFAALQEWSRQLGVGLKFNYPALLGRWAGRYEELLGESELEVVHRALTCGEVSNDMESGWLPGVCPAGQTAFYVTDAGDVTPCAYIPISFGRIGDEPLGLIWERMRRSPVFGQQHRLCLVGEDRAFIERFLAPTFNAARLPMLWSEHPRSQELVAVAERAAES